MRISLFLTTFWRRRELKLRQRRISISTRDTRDREVMIGSKEGPFWGSSAVSVQVDERCGLNTHIGRIRFVFRDLSCFHARCYRWFRLA
jgi:hypothetical protein